MIAVAIHTFPFIITNLSDTILVVSFDVCIHNGVFFDGGMFCATGSQDNLKASHHIKRELNVVRK